MATVRRSEFHTILSEGLRPEVVESQQERHRIEQQVGAYIVAWGYVDFVLSVAASNWANPTNPGALQSFLMPQSTSMKIDLLGSLIPDAWRDGQRLLDQLRAANSHRNVLAHSNLGMGGWNGERALGWHFWNIRGKRERTLEIDGTMMSGHVLTAQVLQEAVASSMAAQFVKPTGDINEVSLADAIIQTPGTWATPDDLAAFQNAARRMFPR